MLRILFSLLLLLGSQLLGELIFQDPPENFQPKMEVVGCFVIVGDQILFLKQLPDDSEANAWGVPGGKLKKNEVATVGMVREIFEETGIRLDACSLQNKGKVYIRYPEMDFTYQMYEVALNEFPEKIVIDPQEHSEYRWMTFKTALELPLIRGEAECIHLVYGEQ